MIAKYHGRIWSTAALREKSFITREGVSVLGIADAAEAIGMRALVIAATIDMLEKEVPLPCIVHWRQKHFVVLYKVRKGRFYVADPAFGKLSYSREEFMEAWLPRQHADQQKAEGIVMLLEPGPEFFETESDPGEQRKGFRFLLPYLRPFRQPIVQLMLGLAVGSLLQLAFPFLTQAIIDYGVNYQNIDFVYLILLGQLMLFASQTLIGIIRAWLLLHIGARVSISLKSDFLIRLMKMPVRYFDGKSIGDLLQRLRDHNRIERFLSSTTLQILFSLFNFVVFGLILAWYNMTIFAVFGIGTLLYVVWVLYFLKMRARLDHKHFEAAAENRSNLIQLIQGVRELKLNNSERKRRWRWEGIQVRLYRIAAKSLALAQMQQIGGLFFNELKNIFITILAAKAVIDGQMTLGMMLAVQYILGQLNAPIAQFISFATTTQDAKISLERLEEIHSAPQIAETATTHRPVPTERDISIPEPLAFRYGGSGTPQVLDDITLRIPEGKVTAIVGASGSGKTTLLRLLLRFYRPTKGGIHVGPADLQSIAGAEWRRHVGVVMQDGFLFSDTVAANIAESSEDGSIDRDRLEQAVHVANIGRFIEHLPNGYNTQIGPDGLPLSGGQKQRLLIARAVYKQPDYLFFDEATSSLDASNERIIMDRLQDFYKGRTVVIIAHRLSTVRHADQILVMDEGRIVESGDHDSLVMARGSYYTLIRNQLELGS